MRILAPLVIVSLLTCELAQGSGQHSERLFGVQLSLEILFLITVVFAIFLAILIFKVAKINSKQLIVSMTLGTIILLVADYLFLKYVYFGGV